VNILAPHHTIAGRYNDGITQIQSCQIDLCFGY
jgi:hypothetical protein